MDDKVKKLIQKVANLEDQRREWEAQWKDISDYIVPYRGFFFDKDLPNQGKTRMSKIIDSTATRAIRILAAGLQSGLTSPSRPWFRLTLRDSAVAEHPLVKKWLGEVEETLRLFLAMSNFYQCSHVAYLDIGSIGTAVVYEEPGNKSPLRFATWEPGSYAISDDAYGRVDTIARRFNMTVRQMVGRFGKENISQSVLRSLETNPYQYFEIVHIIEPNSKRNPDKIDRTNKEFTSIYYEAGYDRKILHHGGYGGFPCMVPRWGTNGADVYGRSPGMDILPDVKMLQEERKTLIEALHKSVKPPLNVPASLWGKASLLPGAENIVVNPAEVITPTMQVNLNLNDMRQEVADTRQAIKEGFFNDLFLMIASSGNNMTATEVLERHEEKLLMLGPVIERQGPEFHDVVIERSLEILGQRGLLPQLPPELAELVQDYQIEYISLLAQAQKMAGTKAITQFTQFAGSLMEAFPDIRDKYDADQAIDRYGDMVGVPVDIIRSDDMVEGIRKRRAQEQEQQRIMEQQMHQQEMMGEEVRQQVEAAGGAEKIARTAKAGGEAAQIVSDGKEADGVV